MTKVSEELLKKPLYGKLRLSEGLSILLLRSILVFDLPPELLASLQIKDQSPTQSDPIQSSSPLQDNPSNGDPLVPATRDAKNPSTSCVLCDAKLPDAQEQRRHVKSDWHGYNLKQKIRGGNQVTEIEFDKLVEDLNESLSGSDASDSEDEDDPKESTLTTLLKKQARIGQPEADEIDEFASKRRKRGAGKPPLIWFSTTLLPSNTSLGFYRTLFTTAEQEQGSDLVKVLRNKQLQPTSSKPSPDGSDGVPLPSTMTSPHIFLCMIGGGHFAGMIVSLAPKVGKKSTGAEDRQATVIAHKTFHRYTTRRKQGGAQSSNDSAKGAAHSAGASIRRHNEAALESEIRTLLTEWKGFIDKSQLIFIRATGSSNRRTLFGPYDGQVLRSNDPRNRGFPFSTRRATQKELMRSFVELTRVKISEIDEAALAAAAAASTTATTEKPRQQQQPPPSSSSSSSSKPTPEEETALHHTSQLHSLIRRNKAPALLSYLLSNSLPPTYPFHPANHHSPTPLHLAAATNSTACVTALLMRAGADPGVVNAEGKCAFELAGERGTRDAFRVARWEIGEDEWDWDNAHVPGPISRSEVEARIAKDRMDAEKAETERRKAEEEKLRAEEGEGEKSGDRKKSGRALGVGVEKTGAERREEEGRGLTVEMRARLERERRARAAEARMRGGIGGDGGGR